MPWFVHSAILNDGSLGNRKCLYYGYNMTYIVLTNIILWGTLADLEGLPVWTVE